MKRGLWFLIILISISILAAGCADGDTEGEDDLAQPQEDIIDEDDSDDSFEKEEVDDSENVFTNKDIMEVLERAESLESYYYEYDIDVEGTNRTVKNWHKGDMVRMEMEVEDGESIVMLINKDGDEYLYYPNENIGYKDTPRTELPTERFIIPMFQDGNIKDQGLQKFIEDISQEELEVLEQAEYDNQTVQVVKVGQDMDYRKIWISEEHGMPLRIEKIVDGNIESTSEVKNFQSKEIDDSQFELPEGIQIEEW